MNPKPTHVSTPDIVERLRDGVGATAKDHVLLGEAAAEIERLRRIDYEEIERVAKLEAEVQRLRGIVQFCETASQQQREGLYAKIERLRAALRQFADRMNWHMSEDGDTIWHEPDDPWDTARAALEGSGSTDESSTGK